MPEKTEQLKPLDPEVRRRLLNEALGYWPNEKGVEMMLLFGQAYGRGGTKELAQCLAVGCPSERYAGAIWDFLTNED